MLRQAVAWSKLAKIFAALKASAFPLLMVLSLTALAVSALGFVSADSGTSGENQFVVDGRQFFYNPGVIRVAQGQTVRITLRAMDVTHGLYLDDYGLGIVAVPGRPAELEFVADKIGQFRFRCTQTCGPLHPFMAGKLVVEPNLPFQGSLALAALLTLGLLALLAWKRAVVSAPSEATTAASCSPGNRGKGPAIVVDFLRWPVIGRFLRWRGFQFAVMLPFLAFLVLALVAAAGGTPVGSHNLGIVFVWIVWWPLLIILLIPFAGRLWCALCPVPAPGEWVQRMSFIRKREGRPLSLGKKWPRRLRSMWLQNGAFLLIALFSAVILTTPRATAVVLITFFVLALALALLFSGRTFCRYVCPLGGFIGLCALVAPLAVRVRDREICRAHSSKECIKGSAAGYGCPWFEYPGTMDRNAYCGLCMECVKTCPEGNIAVGLQPIGHDLVLRGGHSDEAYRAFIALGSAVLYAAVLLGPWGSLKALAGNPLSPGFAVYAGILLGGCLVVVPALFWIVAWLSRLAAGDHSAAVLGLWQNFAYGLVPLALSAWVAFSLALVLVSGHYAIPVLSDPLGRGWNLFGTSGFEGAPTLMSALPYLQLAVLLAGLVWSLQTSWRLSLTIFARRSEAWRALLPVALFLFATTAGFLWLFIG